MLKSIGRFTAAFVVAAATSFAVPASAAEWIYYTPQSAPQYIGVRGAQKFVDKVNADTGGALNLKLRLAGSLQIQASDVTEAVANNVIQMVDDYIFSGNVPLAGVVKLPGIADGLESYDRVEAAVHDVVVKGYDAKGLKVLHKFVIPQYIWGNTKLESLADLKGLKVRTGAPEQSELVRLLGGSPITMGPSEIPAALDRKVIDAVITGIGGGELWADQLSSAYLMPVSFGGLYAVVNKQAFDALPPETQAMVLAASEETGAWLRETSISEDAAATETLKAKMTVTEPSPEDLARMRELVPGVWDTWAASLGEEGAKVLAVVKGLQQK